MKSKPKSELKPKLKSAENSVVKLVANVEDQATGIAYNEYRFRKVGGTWVSHLFDRAKVADPRAPMRYCKEMRTCRSTRLRGRRCLQNS